MHFDTYYCEPRMRSGVVACGVKESQATYTRRSVNVLDVTCEKCKRSERYKEFVATGEIGYDGDWSAMIDDIRAQRLKALLPGWP